MNIGIALDSRFLLICCLQRYYKRLYDGISLEPILYIRNFPGNYRVLKSNENKLMRQLSFRLMDTARTCSMYLRICQYLRPRMECLFPEELGVPAEIRLLPRRLVWRGQGNSLFFTADEFFKIYQLFSILSCSAFISSGVEVYCEMARLRGGFMVL